MASGALGVQLCPVYAGPLVATVSPRYGVHRASLTTKGPTRGHCLPVAGSHGFVDHQMGPTRGFRVQIGHSVGDYGPVWTPKRTEKQLMHRDRLSGARRRRPPAPRHPGTPGTYSHPWQPSHSHPCTARARLLRPAPPAQAGTHLLRPALTCLAGTRLLSRHSPARGRTLPRPGPGGLPWARRNPMAALDDEAPRRIFPPREADS